MYNQRLIKIILGFIIIIINQQALAYPGYIHLSQDIRKEQQVQDLIARSDGKIQVLEFFSYGCSACARFEPTFEKWLATTDNKKIAVIRIPVSFNQDEWLSLANLYYIAKTLDPSGNLNEKIFQALHQKGQRLWEESAMKQFFLDNGFSATQFQAAYNEFSNNKQADIADELSDIYGINETPTIIVNGPTTSYLITADQNQADFFNILDQVIKNAS